LIVVIGFITFIKGYIHHLVYQGITW